MMQSMLSLLSVKNMVGATGKGTEVWRFCGSTNTLLAYYR